MVKAPGLYFLLNTKEANGYKYCAVIYDYTTILLPQVHQLATIEYYDPFLEFTSKMSDLILYGGETAQKDGIAHQIEVIAGQSGTNGWVIQTSRSGVSTGLVSLPIKYMHTPVETASLRDAEAVSDLLTQFIMRIEEVL